MKCPLYEGFHCSTGTVEPPYKGHLGTRHPVHYKEVVLSLEVQNVLSRYEVLHLGPLNLSFIWRLFLLCSLYRVSFIRGIPQYCSTCTFITCITVCVCSFRICTDLGEIIEVPVSVEVKGIEGNDGRQYALDMFRVLPPDANYADRKLLIIIT